MKKQVAFGFIKYSSGEWGPSFGAEVVSIIDIPFVEFEESYTALKQGFIESIKSKKKFNLFGYKIIYIYLWWIYGKLTLK